MESDQLGTDHMVTNHLQVGKCHLPRGDPQGNLVWTVWLAGSLVSDTLSEVTHYPDNFCSQFASSQCDSLTKENTVSFSHVHKIILVGMYLFLIMIEGAC